MHAEDPTPSSTPGTIPDPDPDDLPSAPQPATHLPRPHQPSQARNPLHGLTLETIVTQLADFYGWDDLGQRIPVRCFTHEPSVGSSLKFLRKTPWAREKVESLYLFMLRDQKRQGF
jgi:hypothetical protein